MPRRSDSRRPLMHQTRAAMGATCEAFSSTYIASVLDVGHGQRQRTVTKQSRNGTTATKTAATKAMATKATATEATATEATATGATATETHAQGNVVYVI